MKKRTALISFFLLLYIAFFSAHPDAISSRFFHIAQVHAATTPKTQVDKATPQVSDIQPKETGSVHFRIREIDNNGTFTGKFINGATAKLIDQTGKTVYATATSATRGGNQDGWVYFDNVKVGQYAVITYKQNTVGGWKQTNCGGGVTTDSASLQNENTENLVASWQSDIPIQSSTVTWCKDVGLKDPSIVTKSKGNIHFRVREFKYTAGSSEFKWTGKLINGATAKLTDRLGQTVYATAKSDAEGWIFFDNVDTGDYGILTYKPEYSGTWKQTACEGGGNSEGILYNNANTEGYAAVLQQATVNSGQTTWCKDAGLLLP